MNNYRTLHNAFGSPLAGDDEEKLPTEHIGSAVRQNGFNGDTVLVHLVLDGKALLEVHEHGYHRSPYLPMDIASKEEAQFLLAWNPCARRNYRDRQYAID